MRNKKGQFQNGNPGGPGRPKRLDEEVLIDLWNKYGLKQFEKAVKRGKQWALKKLLDKLFGDKKQTEISSESKSFLNIAALFDESMQDEKEIAESRKPKK